MNIQAREQFRIGQYVNIDFNNGEYNRSVLASDWDTDPQAVIAEVSDYLAKQTPPEVPVVNDARPVFTMTQVEVDTKLVAIKATK